MTAIRLAVSITTDELEPRTLGGCEFTVSIENPDRLRDELEHIFAFCYSEKFLAELYNHTQPKESAS